MAERPQPPHEDDDEALSWAGDESPVRTAPRGAAAPAPDPVGDAVAPEADAPEAAEPVVERASSVLLVASGVLGGIYLLFTVGWIIAARETPALEGLSYVMYVLGQWLAVAAPALWFGATFLLTRHRPAPVKLLWLVIGMLLLVPWPFILNR